jgi:four helix bundle protein
MAKVTQFEDLKIWQQARRLVSMVYRLQVHPAFKRDLAFRDQLQRAAVSVMSNIAEGFERGTNADFIRFLNIAKGSCGEMRSLLYLAEDIGHLPEGSTHPSREDCKALSRQIAGLISYLNDRISQSSTKAENRR